MLLQSNYGIIYQNSRFLFLPSSKDDIRNASPYLTGKEN